jgi:hypothetical protein
MGIRSASVNSKTASSAADRPIGMLHRDPFFQAARRCCAEIACCKCLFQVVQMFEYVASVLYWCCKSRLRCCTYCNMFSSVCPKCFIYFRRILQVFHLDVAKVYLDVAYTCMLQACVSCVSYVCCKCFIWILHMFCSGYKRVFLVFHMHVVSVSIIFRRML